MSYILDALRKADAQRQRDPALGIHAQPARLGEGAGTAHARWNARMRIAGVAVVAATAGAGWYFSRSEPAAPPRVGNAVAAPAPAPVIVPFAPSPPVATAVLPPLPPAAATQPRPVDSRATPSTIAPAPPSKTSPPALPVATAAATGLPPDAPKVVVTGGVYSVNPGQRMLIVNGQVFSEGAELGPGLVLQEIRAKSALLSFRGSRYSVSY
ncbi:MAG: general secretion pathway protein GspB [Ramlibacter sp.]